MTEMVTREEYLEQTKQIYALMGEFVVEFEQVCLSLKTGITILANLQGLKNQELMNAVLAEYTAHPLLKVFISVFCDEQDKVEGLSGRLKEINLRMTKLTELRNDYVHGTLFVGFGNEKTESYEKANGFKLKNTKKGVKVNALNIDDETFKPIIKECRALKDYVHETYCQVILAYTQGEK